MLKSVLVGVTVALAATAVHAQDKAALAAEGKEIMMAFGGSLKGELQAAMKAGGPVNAIWVCNEKAPVIAEQVSMSSGWSVGRSSHKLRNPGNTPDAYTAAAIADFLSREDAGEKAADLVRAEIVEEDGARVFRLVKAIPTEKVCLSCHGGAGVKPEVEAQLAELYPTDEARGFEAGQMRGVFTLMKVLDN